MKQRRSKRVLDKWARRILTITVILVVAYFGWDSGRVLALYFGPSERSLSETGFDLVLAQAGALQNTYSYEPTYPFWSDGADKQRFIHIPENTQIDNSNPDRWNFPEGTRIWKLFERDGVRVETRMLYKVGPQPWQWDMAVYAPTDDQSDSRKLVYARRDTRGTLHDIPSARDCSACHSSDEQRRALGISAVQLPWLASNGLSLSEMIARDMLSDPPDTPYTVPGDSATRAALGYLHSNCGSCHYDGATYVSKKVPLQLDLTVDSLAAVEETNAYRTAVSQAPHLDGLGTSVYIHPGEPSKSFIYKRMAVRDNGFWQMPPLATELADDDGLLLIRHWILSLNPANRWSLGQSPTDKELTLWN